MFTRARTEQRGQTAAEYMGILLVLVGVIGLLAASGIGAQLGDGIREAICRVTGGEDCGGDEQAAAPPEKCLTDRATRTSNLNGTIAVVRIDKDSTLIREDFSDGSSRFTVIDKTSAAGEIYAGIRAQAGNYGVDWSASAEAGAALAGAKVFEVETPEEAEAFQESVQAAGGLDGVLRDITGINDFLGPLGMGDDLVLDALGVDKDEELEPPDATYVESGAFVRGDVEASAALGAIGGEELKALAAGTGSVKVTSSGEDAGDVELSFEIEAGVAASLTAATLGPGASGKAKVTATIKLDAQNGFRPDELEIKANAGYTGSLNTTLDLAGTDLSDVSRTLAEGSFDATAGTGQGVELGATLDLDDPANLDATLDLLLKRDPLSAVRMVDRINDEGELSFDTYDLSENQTEAGAKGGAGVSLGGGGSTASSTESDRSGFVRLPGGTFQPRVCEGPPA